MQGQVRVPTVLVLARFDRVPKRRPKFCAKAIWERDGGVCQYTGKQLRPGEGNIDHVVPLSRGGGSSWENCVLADRKVDAILVNIFAGINRCDWIAEGVVQAFEKAEIKIPVIVRLSGTNVEQGREIIAKSGLPIATADTLAEAAEKAVASVAGKKAA